MSSQGQRDQAQMIHELFLRLHTRYGSTWVAKWAGLDAADVKADWLRVMGHFQDASIQYALQNLPEDSFAPDAPTFARACLRAPSKQVSLPSPSGRRDPKRLAALLEKATAALAEKSGNAAAEVTLKALEARERAGTLTLVHKEHLTALRARSVGSVGSVGAFDGGGFTPIPQSSWPWVQRGDPA
jgi:hypothetical protein